MLGQGLKGRGQKRKASTHDQVPTLTLLGFSTSNHSKKNTDNSNHKNENNNNNNNK